MSIENIIVRPGYKDRLTIEPNPFTSFYHCVNDSLYSYLDNRRNRDQITIEKSNIEFTIGGKQITLPRELENIAQELKRSEYILSLQEDWDESGAIPPPAFIYQRAVELLVNYAKYILINHKVAIKAPQINPGHDGAVGLDWRTRDWELLINVSNSENFIASYYGDNKTGSLIIEGILSETNVLKDLAYWMQKLI